MQGKNLEKEAFYGIAQRLFKCNANSFRGGIPLFFRVLAGYGSQGPAPQPAKVRGGTAAGCAALSHRAYGVFPLELPFQRGGRRGGPPACPSRRPVLCSGTLRLFRCDGVGSPTRGAGAGLVRCTRGQVHPDRGASRRGRAVVEQRDRQEPGADPPVQCRAFGCTQRRGVLLPSSAAVRRAAGLF